MGSDNRYLTILITDNHLQKGAIEMKSYRLSTDISNIGNHLLNTRNGDVFEIDDDARSVLSTLALDNKISGEETPIIRFMIDEGILACPDINHEHDKFHLQWHLLNNCNLRCKHCYDSKNPTVPLTFEQMRRVVDDYVLFVKKMDMDGEISLTGGEPMLVKHLPELIEYIKSRDVFISTFILTNGTIPFSKEQLYLFKKHDIGVQISIDGMGEVNDSIRGDGVFDKCRENLRRLHAQGINTSVHYVIMRRNVADLEPFILEMDRLHVKRIHFSTLVPIGPGADEDVVTPIESKRLMEWLMRYQDNVDVSVVGRRPLWTLVGSDGFCPVGYKTLTIYADGTAFPCRRLPIPIGDIRTDSFFKIWFTSELLEKMRNREKFVKICGTCAKAEECGGCRAIAYAASGDPFAPDPSCWLIDSQYNKNERG